MTSTNPFTTGSIDSIETFNQQIRPIAGFVAGSGLISDRSRRRRDGRHRAIQRSIDANWETIRNREAYKELAATKKNLNAMYSLHGDISEIIAIQGGIGNTRIRHTKEFLRLREMLIRLSKLHPNLELLVSCTGILAQSQEREYAIVATGGYSHYERIFLATALRESLLHSRGVLIAYKQWKDPKDSRVVGIFGNRLLCLGENTGPKARPGQTEWMLRTDNRGPIDTRHEWINVVFQDSNRMPMFIAVKPSTFDDMAKRGLSNSLMR